MNITRDINLNTVAEMVFSHQDFEHGGILVPARPGMHLPPSYKPGEGDDPVSLLCSYIANIEGVRGVQLVTKLKQVWIRFTDSVLNRPEQRTALELKIDEIMRQASMCWLNKKAQEAERNKGEPVESPDEGGPPTHRPKSVTELDMAIRGAEATMPTQPIIRRS